MRKQGREVKARIKERKLNMTQVPTQEIIVQPVVSELIVEDFSNNPDYRKCTMCEEYHLLNRFYQNKNTGYYHSRCIPCHNQYSNNRLIDYYQEKYRTKGGSERVLPKAGHFTDIYQEEQTSWLLDLLGWSKDGEVWVKKGIKTIQDGKIVWDKIPTKEKKKRILKPRRIYDVEGIVDLRKSGATIETIARINHCSSPTIRKILIEVDEKTR
jgi:hypothetical protein